MIPEQYNTITIQFINSPKGVFQNFEIYILIKRHITNNIYSHLSLLSKYTNKPSLNPAKASYFVRQITPFTLGLNCETEYEFL